MVYGNHPSPTRPARRTAGSVLPPSTIGIVPSTRSGVAGHLREGPVPPLVGRRRSGPERTHGVDALLEPPPTVGVRHADGCVLLALPADPESEAEAFVGEQRYRRRALGEHRGAVQRGDHDGRTEQQRRRARAEMGKQLERIGHRGRAAGERDPAVGRVRIQRFVVVGDHDVFDGPDRVDPALLDGARVVAEEAAVRREVAPERREHADLHGAHLAPPSGN